MSCLLMKRWLFQYLWYGNESAVLCKIVPSKNGITLFSVSLFICKFYSISILWWKTENSGPLYNTGLTMTCYIVRERSFTELKQAKWKSFTEGPQELIFSDSMLSNIDQQKLQNTKVVVMSGAWVEEIKTELQKPEYHGARLDRLVLMTGTNDLTDAKDKPDSIPDIVQKYSALIEDAKAISQYVTISSVCPRIDDVTELVEPFNTNMPVLVEDKDCEFIDHTPSSHQVMVP